MTQQQCIIAFIRRTQGQYMDGPTIAWFEIATLAFPDLKPDEFAAALRKVGEEDKAHAEELRRYVSERQA